MDKKKLLDDIFAAGEDEDVKDILKDIEVILYNIEDDLTILIQSLTEHI